MQSRPSEAAELRDATGLTGTLGTIAVTGASGRLGRRLVRLLRKTSLATRIVLVDRRRQPMRAPGIDSRIADVRDPGLHHHFEHCSAVVHLAFVLADDVDDEAEAVNIDGTLNVVESAVRAGVRHLVVASSIAAYGFHRDNGARVLTETDLLRGNESFAYANDKARVERLLDGYESRFPTLRIARMRPSFFFGNGASDLAWFRGVPGYLPYIDSSIPVHATHEDDVALAFALALERRAHGAYNIATRSPLPLRAWARHLRRHPLPLPPTVLHGMELWRRLGLMETDLRWLALSAKYPINVSSAKARRELHWRPRYDTTAQVLWAIADSLA